MLIQKCGIQDCYQLAEMNKKLIEDEQSDNPMTLEELHNRMKGFLEGEYSAYFFIVAGIVIGYALVRHSSTPLYLRQFFIDREYRQKHHGKLAFQELMTYLKVETIDIDVLPWNHTGISFWKNCGFEETCISMRYQQ